MMEGRAITKEWVHAVLEQAGYREVRYHDTLPDTVQGEYEGRPTITVRVLPDHLQFLHVWKMEGKEKEIQQALNKANARSSYDTYSRHDDGRLVVSSYMVMTESISGDDVTRFLAAESDAFQLEIVTSGLYPYCR